MKNKIIFIGVLALFSACKDYLDMKSSNRLAVPVELSDLQALLDDQVTMNNLRTPSISQSACDDSFRPENTQNSLTAQARLQYQWNPFFYTYSNDWSAAYQAVYNANYCLEQLENIDKEQLDINQWENVYGAALFYKAYYYLGLMWAFAPPYNPIGPNDALGIVLRNSSDFNVKSVFSTVDECYKEIIALAEASLTYLPDKPLVKTRPSKWAAHALLARAYLSMALYDYAADHANKSLEYGDELIDFNNPADGIAIDANVPFAKFTKETIFYSEMTQKFDIHVPANGAVIDTILYEMFAEGDLRKRAYYRDNGNYKRFKGSHSHSNNWLFSGLTTAEMLLIRAEGKARSGDVSESLADINMLLRTRWDNTLVFEEKVVEDKEDILKLVLDERRKELAMRGIRWSDIKRLNLEGRNIVLQRKLGDELITLAPNSDGYQLPLPADLAPFFE